MLLLNGTMNCKGACALPNINIQISKLSCSCRLEQVYKLLNYAAARRRPGGGVQCPLERVIVPPSL